MLCLLLEVRGGARLQGSPVSFTFNAFNLIVLVELSKTEEEVGLCPLDLADRFFSPLGFRERWESWQPLLCRKYDLNPN